MIWGSFGRRHRARVGEESLARIWLGLVGSKMYGLMRDVCVFVLVFVYGLTLDEDGNTRRQGGSKGPLLLEEIAPLCSPDIVDGVPRCQPRKQAARMVVLVGVDEQDRRRVVGRANLAPGGNGKENCFPCDEDDRYGEVRAVRPRSGGHGWR